GPNCGRGVAQLPGARHPAAHPDVGQHDRGRPGGLREAPAPRLHPGHRAVRDGLRAEQGGRPGPPHVGSTPERAVSTAKSLLSSSPSAASLRPAPTRSARQSLLPRPGGARQSRTPPATSAGAKGESGLVSAARWRRTAARATDLATGLVVQWGLAPLHAFWFVPVLSQQVAPAPWGEAFVATVLFVILTGVYEVAFMRWNDGRTPGKDAWHIRVVCVSDGTRPGLLRSLARWAGPGLALLVWPLWLAAGALLAWGAPTVVTSRRRALHDILCHTEVVADPRNGDDES